MNVKHLRAKYQIEQYPVVFTFPEQVLYEPRVRVEVVSGVDPTPQAFAGLPFVKDNQVAILVAGGVPGAIYKISCEVDLLDEVVELSGVVAIKDTAGIVPEGTSALPLTLTLSTPPYPVYVVDSIGSGSGSLSGKTFEGFIDSFESQSQSLDSTLREVLQDYTYVEAISIGSVALNGARTTPIVSFSIAPESLDTTSVALNSVRKTVLIKYSNYEPEELDITSVALGGTKV